MKERGKRPRLQLVWGALAGATALQLCLLLFGGGRLQVYWPGPRLADTEPLLNEEAWPPPLPPPGSRHFGAAATSRFWGEAGEAWHPAGPFMDFSYAGYRMGEEPLPHPPARASGGRSVLDFQRGTNRTSGEALEAAVAWANGQPPEAGWVVLTLPPGDFTLDRRLALNRSQTVLRGAGSGATRLLLPHSLMELYGPTNRTNNGYYVWTGAFLSVEGAIYNASWLSNVTAPAARGSYRLQVDNPAAIFPGDLVTLVLQGGEGELSQELLNHKLKASAKFSNHSVRFSSRVAAVQGATVTLERALPLAVQPAFQPSLIRQRAVVSDVGLEGFAMHFRHQPYGGHHLEAGFNGIELSRVADCWVRDVALVNADSGVLVTGSTRVTVQGLNLTVTADRRGGPDKHQFEGHWGVRVGSSTDVLVRDFAIHPSMVHGVGADSMGQFSVFAGGWMADGNTEMHRAQAAQVLYTDLSLGRSSEGFYSGGPSISGPNAGAWSVWWNIRSDTGDHPLPEHNGGKPGACSFGPDLSWIGVTFRRAAGGTLCPDWFHQPAPVHPPNLYQAQLERRRRLVLAQQTAVTAAVDAEAAVVRAIEAAALAPPPIPGEAAAAAGAVPAAAATDAASADPAAAAAAAAAVGAAGVDPVAAAGTADGAAAAAATGQAPAHTPAQAAALAALEAEEE